LIMIFDAYAQNHNRFEINAWAIKLKIMISDGKLIFRYNLTVLFLIKNCFVISRKAAYR
jgi:hypothetical protein